MTSTDDTEDAHRKVRSAALEVRRERCEIEVTALNREVYSPLATAQEREAAMERRDTLLAEWAQIVDELQRLRRHS